MSAHANSPAKTARRLREARAYLELSTELVSSESGIAPAALAAIETAARLATDLELKRLSRLYGYPVSYFLGEDQPLDQETVEIVGRWAAGVSADDREEALRFALYLRYAGRAEG